MSQSALPKDFLWGFATASFQIEGSNTADGRGASIWDAFCDTPGKIADGSDGSVACDSYNRWEEDIALLKSYGAKAYRFSISWSRIIPLGGRNDPINQAGIDFYVRFIDALIAAGIEPVVTVYHWDLPEALYSRYGGFVSEEIIPDFVNYATVLFNAFGSRVKHWITFNEPYIITIIGYSTGRHAPGRTSDRKLSPVGDSSTEPWTAAHHILIAHGRAVKVFREQFKPKNGGVIGITLNGDWAEAWDPSDPLDVEAAQRRMEFSIAWYADPIYHGKYPDSMRAQLGDRLPHFTEEERAVVQGSNDFYGMNTYTAKYARHRTTPASLDDFEGNLDSLQQNKAGEWIGPEAGTAWLRPNPPGFRSLLNWISDRCGKPIIIVTENGTCEKEGLPVDQIINDEHRCKYYTEYVGQMVKARNEDGVNVRGYFAWSLLDNFEWAEGYLTRFGVTYVDYKNGMKRTPKKSAGVVRDLFNTLVEK